MLHKWDLNKTHYCEISNTFLANFSKLNIFTDYAHPYVNSQSDYIGPRAHSASVRIELRHREGCHFNNGNCKWLVIIVIENRGKGRKPLLFPLRSCLLHSYNIFYNVIEYVRFIRCSFSAGIVSILTLLIHFLFLFFYVLSTYYDRTKIVIKLYGKNLNYTNNS